MSERMSEADSKRILYGGVQGSGSVTFLDSGRLDIDVGGLVIAKPLQEWHRQDAELSALRQENYRLKVALKQALGAVVALLEDIKTPCVQEAVAAIRPFLTEEKAEEKKP